jgi:type IV pilus assembly protein PilB
VTRLVDMGVEPYLVASSLTVVVAQRLVRRPCVTCVEPYEPAAELLSRLRITPDDLREATPMRGSGCIECSNSGYRGRLGIFELLSIDTPMRDVLLKTPTENAVSRVATKEGMITLRQAGLAKAMHGLTTFEEVLRVS